MAKSNEAFFDSELIRLHEFSLILNSTHSIDEIVKQSAIAICDIFAADGCHIIFAQKTRNELNLETAIHYGGKPFPPELDETQGISGHTFKTGERVLIEDTLTDSRVSKQMLEYIGHRSVVSAPVIVKGEIIGAVVIYSMVPNNFSLRDGEYLCLLGNHLGMAVENARLLQELKRASTTEPLTGLYNRGFAAERCECFITNYPEEYLSIILFDVNDLKVINDNYGHLVGDRLLQEIALIFKTATRTNDIIARYGGDEFIFILPSCNPENAVTIAHAVEDRLKLMTLSVHNKELKISVSWGVAGGKCNNFSSIDALIYQADKHLYEMKRFYKSKAKSGIF